MLTVFADVTPLSAVFLGLVPVGGIWFVLAFAGADVDYFDPRPAVRRASHAVRLAVESGAWDGQLIAVANIKHAARTAAHPSAEALRDAAALLLLLTTSPKGALR